jgi:hypothetical protein
MPLEDVLVGLTAVFTLILIGVILLKELKDRDRNLPR